MTHFTNSTNETTAKATLCRPLGSRTNTRRGVIVNTFAVTNDPAGVTCTACLRKIKNRNNPSLQQQVNESLQNALDNGYKLNKWSAQRIVDDIRAYDADLEDLTNEQLLPLVEVWKAAQVQR